MKLDIEDCQDHQVIMEIQDTLEKRVQEDQLVRLVARAFQGWSCP